MIMAKAGSKPNMESETALPNMNLIFPNVCIPAVRFAVPAGKMEIGTLVETEFTDRKIVIGGGNCYALGD